MIFFILLITVIILICIFHYYDTHHFMIPYNKVGVLSNDNKTVYCNRVYSHSKKDYKKDYNSQLYVYDIFKNNQYKNVWCITKNDKRVNIQLEYNYSYDLTYLIDIIHRYGLKQSKHIDSLESYLNDITTNVIMEYSRKELYNYMTIDDCIKLINERLSTYLLKKRLYIDVEVIKITVFDR